MLHRFEIFSAPGTIAHGSIRLPTGASRLRDTARCSVKAAVSKNGVKTIRGEFFMIIIIHYYNK